MKNSELYKLACQCLVLDDYPEKAQTIKEKIISGDLDIYRFIYLCSNQLVLPLVYRQLRETGVTELFPEDYDEFLSDIYDKNTQRNTKILEQIEEISNILQTNNIEPVYLKGTANLLDNLYRNPGDRFIGDIDFLVQKEDYLRTADLIMQLGYKNDVKLYFDPQDQKHYPRLYRDDVPADIEIHHIPVNKEYAKKFNSEIIFPNKLKVLNKVNCYVSSDVHKLVHTFIHSQLSNRGYLYKYIPLRDLYDFYLLSKKVPKTDFFQEVEEKQKAGIFYAGKSYLLNVPVELNEFNSVQISNYFKLLFWLLDHPLARKTYVNFVSLNIFIFKKIPELFLSKTMFKSFVYRISDREYWQNHFMRGIKKYF